MQNLFIPNIAFADYKCKYLNIYVLIDLQFTFVHDLEAQIIDI